MPSPPSTSPSPSLDFRCDVCDMGFSWLTFVEGVKRVIDSSKEKICMISRIVHHNQELKNFQAKDQVRRKNVGIVMAVAVVVKSLTWCRDEKKREKVIKNKKKIICVLFYLCKNTHYF